jgi:large subunit ribosomal protein L21
MYAIIRAGGKQFRAEPGKFIRIPSIDAEAGDSITFDEVLLGASDSEVKVGLPLVDGAQVTAEVVRHGKGEKITIFKHKRRKNYRRKQGHRQKFTEVRINEVQLG